MSFDPITADFELHFIINTDVEKSTVIYLNEEFNYPHGVIINVIPSDSLVWTSTTPNYYEFTPNISTKNQTTIILQISPNAEHWIGKIFHWIKNIIFA